MCPSKRREREGGARREGGREGGTNSRGVSVTYREKMSLLEELAQLFAATDNFYLSRDLLFRVRSGSLEYCMVCVCVCVCEC